MIHPTQASGRGEVSRVRGEGEDGDLGPYGSGTRPDRRPSGRASEGERTLGPRAATGLQITGLSVQAVSFSCPRPSPPLYPYLRLFPLPSGAGRSKLHWSWSFMLHGLMVSSQPYTARRVSNAITEYSVLRTGPDRPDRPALVGWTPSEPRLCAASLGLQTHVHIETGAPERRLWFPRMGRDA
ncbi:hypothetical protein LZ30DRAFT_378328 [Colletotrichum cereale]|nr:hypothetical protein LZ30DRAFT_378328 [Colletotrichum cereale]